MEIAFYVLENFIFPLLIALIIKYIEKRVDRKWWQVKKKDGSCTYRLFWFSWRIAFYIFLGITQELFWWDKRWLLLHKLYLYLVFFQVPTRANPDLVQRFLHSLWSVEKSDGSPKISPLRSKRGCGFMPYFKGCGGPDFMRSLGGLCLTTFDHFMESPP